VADLGSQAIIHSYLSKTVPQDSMIAEECGTSLSSFHSSPHENEEKFLSFLSDILCEEITLTKVPFHLNSNIFI
jgi:3'-phosphoadenosine 5'-phosphosulfate (PAPS) 3'-phosphatase